jgi:hypothetical protein
MEAVAENPGPSSPPPLPAATTGQSVAPRRKWVAPLTLLLIAAGLTYVYFVDPTSKRSIPCAFYEVTGLHCPGCGSTRAAHALVHGRLFAAIGYNPLAAIVLPVVAIRALLTIVRPRQATKMLPAAWVYAIFALVMAYWIGRNIPVYPFTLLAP